MVLYIKFNLLQAMKRASGGGNQIEERESNSPCSDGDVPLREMGSTKPEERDTVSLNSRDSSEDQFSNEDTTTLLSDDEHSNSSVDEASRIKTKRSHGIGKVLLHVSFYVVGIAVLIVGSVGSRYTPYVDPEDYSNCSSNSFPMNETNDSLWI